MGQITWDDANSTSYCTLSNSDRTVDITSGGAYNRVRAGNGVSSGKYYFEYEIESVPDTFQFVGICNSSADTDFNASYMGYGDNASYEWGYRASGSKYAASSNSGYGASWTTGDIIGVALDMDNGAIWMSKNGAWQNGASASEIAAGTTTNAMYTGLSGTIYPCVVLSVANTSASIYGSTADQSYTAPSGFGEMTQPGAYTPDVSAAIAITPSFTASISPNHANLSVAMSAGLSGVLRSGRITGDLSLSFPLGFSSSGTKFPTLRSDLSLSIDMSYTSQTSDATGILAAAIGDVDADITGVSGYACSIDGKIGDVDASITASIEYTGDIVGDDPVATIGAEISGLLTIIGGMISNTGTVDADLTGHELVTGTISTNIADIDGSIIGVIDFDYTLTVPVINLRNNAVTEYESTQYNSIIEWGGNYYGANDNGVYQITGDTDAGEDIDAYVKTGVVDHGSGRIKRPSDVYLSGKSDDKVVFSVIVDDDTQYDYEVSMKNTHDVRKGKLGRGIRSRYLQYQLANKNGADFDLDKAEIILTPVDRRKR